MEIGVNNRPGVPFRLGDRHNLVNYIVISFPRTGIWIGSTCRVSSCTLWIWRFWRSMFWFSGPFLSSFVWFHLCSNIWKEQGLCWSIFHNQTLYNRCHSFWPLKLSKRNYYLYLDLLISIFFSFWHPHKIRYSGLKKTELVNSGTDCKVVKFFQLVIEKMYGNH